MKGGLKFDSLESKSLDFICIGLSNDVSIGKKCGIPPKLQKNWEKLQVSCLIEQFEEYYPKLSEKGKKGFVGDLLCSL